MFRHRPRRVPRLNTTSTADISFMLLIFFLVTTSMDVDKGLSRQLPPPDLRPQTEETNVEKHNLMTLEITADNRLYIDQHPVRIADLRQTALHFIQSRGKQHLFSISIDPNSGYDTYFQMQNELVAAYNIARNEWALRKFGRRYSLCSQQQREAVKALCPQRIAENYDAKREGGDR